jgi:hypothetical protein
MAEALKTENMQYEYLFLLLFAVGFVLLLSAASLVIGYIIILACGLFNGREFYRKRLEIVEAHNFFFSPFFIMSSGLIMGLLLAGLFKQIDYRIILAVFIGGNLLGYFLHEQEIFRIRN